MVQKCVKRLEKYLTFGQFSMSNSYYYHLVSILRVEDAPIEIIFWLLKRS